MRVERDRRLDGSVTRVGHEGPTASFPAGNPAQ